MLDRKKIPVSGLIKDIEFPPYTEHILANGLKVLMVKDDRFPVTTCRMLIKAGSYNDFFVKTEKYGLATLSSEMLNKGTGSKSQVEIANILDYNGALFSSGAGYDASYLSLSCLKKNFEPMFGLFSELFLDSTFPEDELEQKKDQLISSLISLSDEGSFLAERAFKTKIYTDSPYEKDPDGYPESLKNIISQDLVQFRSDFYKLNEITLAFVGDIDEGRLLFLTEKYFGKEKGLNRKLKYDFSCNENKSTRIFVVDKKDSVQTSLYIGHSGIKRNNIDFIPVVLLNTLFGGMFTSRINKNLREKNGLTYGARSSYNCKKHSGDFSVEAEVNDDKAGFAISEIIKEMNEIRNNPITDYELENARNYITGNFPLQLETSNSVAGKLLSLDLYDIDNNFYNHYLSSVNSLTADDLMETAKKYIRPDELTIVAVGKLKRLKTQLKDFGNLEIIEKVQ
ncbi:MAG: pitrilysin family protein [Ignavibacteria bacterium]|nr:pitrilysin family protein [Ignavibacteria bacterium]